MPAPFGNFHLVSALPASATFSILSPASGVVQDLSHASQPAAQHGLFGEGICLQLKGNKLLAPFAGEFLRMDACGQLISLRHRNGLRLDLRFPAECLQHHGRGFDWQLGEQAHMQQGQCLLQFDLSLFTQWIDHPRLLITLPQHHKFNRIWGRPCYHEAGIDPLFAIEMKSSQPSSA